MMMNDPLAAYRAMTPADRRQVLMAEYRCATPKRCLLMHIWQTPHGRMYYIPAYRLSPNVTNTETVESARRKRVRNGRWQPTVGSLDELLEFFDGADLIGFPGVRDGTPGTAAGGLPLNCAHVRTAVSAEELARVIAGVHPGRPARITVGASFRSP